MPTHTYTRYNGRSLYCVGHARLLHNRGAGNRMLVQLESTKIFNGLKCKSYVKICDQHEIGIQKSKKCSENSSVKRHFCSFLDLTFTIQVGVE